MRIAPEGLPFVVSGLVVAAILTVVARSIQTGGLAGPTLTTVSVLSAVFSLFSLWFFRNPTPKTPSDPSAVVSPAEGKVVEIVTLDEPGFMGGQATRISVFLSVFNVHVQRAPLSGTVRLREYHPGLYLAAWEPKASEANERATLGIQTEHGPILVRQIAGLVARRIVTDPAVDQPVERGDRIGLIRFGSRVDLFVPPSWDVEVEVGDRVRVGETVMARVKPMAAAPEGA